MKQVHDIAKECVFNVLELLYNRYDDEIWIVLKSSGKWEMIWKNPDSCDRLQKMGNDPEKSGQFLKPSGKWEMI